MKDCIFKLWHKENVQLRQLQRLRQSYTHVDLHHRSITQEINHQIDLFPISLHAQETAIDPGVIKI